MLRKQGVRLAAYAVVGSTLLGACGPDPTSPRPHERVTPPSAAVATETAGTTGASAAIEDALTRLLPSLEPTTAELLKGPLLAVRSILRSQNNPALTDAISGVRAVLAHCAPLADDPDLAAIALALDAAELNGR
jgi:hypothetical protein